MKKEIKVVKDSNPLEKFFFNITIVLVFFKLFPGSIINSWSWWAVTVSLWAPLLFLLIFIFVTFVYVFIMNIGVNDKKLLNTKEKFMTMAVSLLLTLVVIYGVIK